MATVGSLRNQIKSSTAKYKKTLREAQTSILGFNHCKQAEVLKDQATKANQLLVTHLPEPELINIKANLSQCGEKLDLNVAPAVAQLSKIVTDLPEDLNVGKDKDPLYLMTSKFQSRLGRLVSSERQILSTVLTKGKFFIEPLHEISRNHTQNASTALAVLRSMGEAVEKALLEQQKLVREELPPSKPEQSPADRGSTMTRPRIRRRLLDEGPLVVTNPRMVELFSSPSCGSTSRLTGSFDGSKEQSLSNDQKLPKTCAEDFRK